jgi:hypothetical protein
VDDGDGIHILPVTVRLPLVNVNPASTTTPTTQSLGQTQAQAHTQTQTPTQRHFIPAKERKTLRKIAFLESQLASQVQSGSQKNPMVVKKKEKEYQRNDIRVGDTVRIKGRIEEYRRGNGEWVRQVVVEPGSGGFIGMSPKLG